MTDQNADKAAEKEAVKSGRREAKSLMTKAVAAYVKGEQGATIGYLDCGRLLDEGVQRSLSIGDTREAAVQIAAGDFSSAVGEAVDVNRLIACYHADRLLRDLATVQEPLAYSLYRDSFIRLVERTQKGERSGELWVILPGMEADSRALFSQAANLPPSGRRQKAADGSKDIHSRYATMQAAQAKGAKEEAAKASQAAQEKADAERAAAVKAQEAKSKAAEEAKQARLQAEAAKSAEDKAAALAVLKAAQEKALLATKAAEEQDAAKRTAERDANKADKAHADAVKTVTATEKKADKSAGLGQKRPTTETSTQGENILRQAGAATPQQCGESAAEYIRGSKDSDSAAIKLAELLAESKCLSEPIRAAFKAAVSVIRNGLAALPVAQPVKKAA